MLVHRHLVYDVGSHLQAVFQLVERREEHLLDDLQVAEIAHGQVVHDEHDLLRQALKLVALGPDELKHVGVLLVGHYRRAGGTLLGQLHEGEVLTVEQACVKRHLCQRSGHGGEGKRHVALHLATSHLGIDHVIVHRVEAQQLGGHRAVQGERRAIAGGRAEGVAVGHAPGGEEVEHVVGKRFGIGAKPQSEAAGHSHLQVCVARHEHVLILLALLQQLVKQNLHAVDHLAQLMACEELQVNEHLVVARATRMDLLAHVAEALREHQLHLRVHILHAVLNNKLSAVGHVIDALQLGKELLQLIFLKQPDALKHGYVGHGAQHVIFGEVEVELAVTSHGETLYLLVHFKVFFPKFVCHIVIVFLL